jgi:hypothetical protein
MKYYRDRQFPNGWIKSRLYDVFLTYHHFGISIGEYELNLEFARIDERNGDKNCAWYRDIDGKLVVTDLQLQDRDIRIVITDHAFEFLRKPKERRLVRVFISYAREDYAEAKKFFDRLNAAGFEPWLDKECLLPGERWEVGVEHAIRSSHYFIALLSSHSVVKHGYVQKEIRRALEILEQMPESDIYLIPARLANCHPSHTALEKLNWVDMFPDWDQGFEKIVKTLRTHTGWAPHTQDQGSATDESIFELLCLLLLIDQFPTGVWGASLESSADLYGHGNDPGSITISTLSSFSITHFTGSRNAQPIIDYRNYLQTRQSDSGAFGMKRELGTGKYRMPKILEHARHTATGLSFFLFYDGANHPSVKKALKYLFTSRTPRGVWVDVGPAVDEEADPITAAFVIDALEQVHASISSKPRRTKSDNSVLSQLDQAIVNGLDYIFYCPFRTPDGFFWSYKFSTSEAKKRVFQNLYQYTTDVISSITTSCKRLNMYLPEIDNVIEELFSIANDHQNSLPSSPESHVPNLDSTARLISTARLLPQWNGQATITYEALPGLCSDKQVIISGGANGWSAALQLYDTGESSQNYNLDERKASIFETANRLKTGDPNNVELPAILIPYSVFVRTILLRRSGVQPA